MASSQLMTRALYLIAFLDLFAVSLVIPLFSRNARELGASPIFAGIIASIYGAVQLFSSPVVGEWSDQSGRRYVLLWCLSMCVASYTMMGASSNVWILALARIPIGMFKHSQELARLYLADLLPPEQHSAAFGKFNAFGMLGFVIGPSIGGHIGELEDGFAICSYLCAIVFLVQFGIMWWVFPPHSPTPKHTSLDDNHKECKSGSVSLLSGLKVLLVIDWSCIWDILLAKFLIGFAVMVYRSNFSMWLDYKFGASTTFMGYLISYSGLVGMCSGFFVGPLTRWYSNDSKLFLHTAVAQTLCIFSLTFVPNLWMLPVMMAPLSMANAVARVATTKVTMDRMGGQDLGAVMGLGASVLSLARMLSPAIGGVVQELHVSGPTLLGTLMAGMACAVLLLSPRYRAELKKSENHHNKVD